LNLKLEQIENHFNVNDEIVITSEWNGLEITEGTIFILVSFYTCFWENINNKITQNKKL